MKKTQFRKPYIRLHACNNDGQQMQRCLHRRSSLQ